MFCLLAEKNSQETCRIRVIEIEDASELVEGLAAINRNPELTKLDHAREKWIQYYLDADEIGLLREASQHPTLFRLRHFGHVDVGVVTGNNQFFVLKKSEVETYRLHQFMQPLVGRTAQLKGIVLTEQEWHEQSEKDVACHLLQLTPQPFQELPTEVQEYLEQGKLQEVHQGFKCRTRKAWYSVPSPWKPDAFLFRQIHSYPKMVVNRALATSTDTVHRVRLLQPENAALTACCFLNSLTFAFAEVMGRSYGGGVLELEPSEAEQLPLPYSVFAYDEKERDTLERQGQIQHLLDIMDREVLCRHYGFTVADVQRFRRIWNKLAVRRTGRRTSRLN